MPWPEPDESICRRATEQYGREHFADTTGMTMQRKRRTMFQGWIQSPPEADLRDVLVLDRQGRDWTYQELLAERASWAYLVPGSQFRLWAFLHSDDGQPWIDDAYGFSRHSVGNQPLGPLAELQVYATDPRGEYVRSTSAAATRSWR
jgi:hypothetical protein